MKTLLYDTQTRQITIKSHKGTVNLPNPSSPVIQSENTIQFPLECIFGNIQIDSFCKCLYFCSESEKQGTFNNGEIFKVIKVNYVSLTDDLDKDAADSIVNLFESLNFYYLIDQVEEHFLWNGEMLKNFKEWAVTPYLNCITGQNTARNPFSNKIKESKIVNNLGQMVIGQLICGYFETQIVREGEKAYKLTIFSRISTKKIGTRLLSRGVDELGKVSFFVETKFITELGDVKNEFTILRGSVPVFWSQNDPLKPHKIQIEKDIEKNRKAFQKHFKLQQECYGKIVVVDLLGSKKYEQLLSQLYQDLCEDNSIDYIHFDLNKYSEDIESIKCILYKKIFDFIKNYRAQTSNELQSGNEISNSLSSSLKDSKIRCTSFINCNSGSSTESEENAWDDDDEDFNRRCDSPDYLSLQSKDDEMKNINITFRVNCMDCLDRTNIGEYIIFRYFNNLKFQVIKTMWVNNGNALSHMYTGSNSLKTDLPSRGKLSVLGKMSDFVISANRMIQNKFIDKDKQAIIDLILGKKSN